MSLSIVHKLVAAFIGLTLLVLVATLGLARWSFQQGFLDYVNALEQVRLERLQAQIANDYIDAGSQWGFVTDAYLGQMLRPEIGNTAARLQTGPNVSQTQLGLREPPPRPRAGPEGRDGGRPGRDRPQGFSPSPAPSFAPPTALFDNNELQIAGPLLKADAAALIRVPVTANGQQVGELRSDPRRQIDEPLETAFSKRQLTTSWIIGSCSLLLALLVSLGLARGLSAPIKRMISGVGRLSAGDYSQRMQEQRRDELGQLTRDIDHLAITLEQSQSARRRLLADVSHELRTPLTVLSGEIEALKDGLRAFDETQLDSLDQEVQRLRHLVNDLYQLSLSDAGGLRYEFAPIDLAERVHDASSNLQTRACQAGLTMSIKAESALQILIFADARRIDQLLSNLLENAIAYTDPPGTIETHLSCTDHSALLRIEDSAPGASESECEQLFEPLYRQESSRTRRSGGAGLGLAICRSIVTAHGGTIAATPSPLGGVSIVMSIPLAQENRI